MADDLAPLLLEVPLPPQVAEKLGGNDKAPLALFLNLGWLLGGDSKRELVHEAVEDGEAAVRALHWMALAAYAQKDPSLLKMTAYPAPGGRVVVKVQPVGETAEAIREVYCKFGIELGNEDKVVEKICDVLKALREAAFALEEGRYVVADVGSHIAFSAAVKTLILSSGYVSPFLIAINAGSAERAKKIAEALDAVVDGKFVILRDWMIRLLLPVAPSPVYKKDVVLYVAIIEYAAAAKVEAQKGAYLLERRDGLFVAKGKEAEALYQELRRYDIPVKPRRRGGEVELALTGWQLEYLKNRGLPVTLLNELEYDKEQKRRQQTV
ncbi:hypothetical protein [Pyrobaculum calidifontis]|uniref:Uncharacterized protein n=1 Tax=Pyrobaculum calidifontis (strain DSM 21063 / JCM 11548 / VA1) TaxID=410359 RepID=A3MXN3_PYRCJ|nr:hypothetical protein [Pyrobaculum calidifontis]ABO09400.1 hypothetical protein Pcal_1985 [Pyrobaculum calidifontis JCM 11548]